MIMYKLNNFLKKDKKYREEIKKKNEEKAKSKQAFKEKASLFQQS